MAAIVFPNPNVTNPFTDLNGDIWDYNFPKTRWARRPAPLGTAANYDVGTTSGKIPVIGSGNKLDASIIPTPDLSGLVPYTGATANLDMNSRNITGLDGVSVIGGSLCFLPSAGGNLTADNGTYSGMTVGNATQSTQALAVWDGVTFVDLSNYTGSSSITTLGAVTVGTWNADAIGDSYIASAATWNAKQDALSFSPGGNGSADSGKVPLFNPGGSLQMASNVLVHGAYSIEIIPTTLTASHTALWPDKAGTVAMTSDITGTNSGTNTGDETAARIGTIVSGATAKATPIDADKLGFWDSVGTTLKQCTMTQFWTNYIKPLVNAGYVALTGNQTIAGNKTLSGQTELTGQTATNGTSAMTRDLAMNQMLDAQNIVLLGALSYSAVASGASASSSDGSVIPNSWALNAGTTTAGHANVIIGSNWDAFNEEGTIGWNFAKPFKVAGYFFMSAVSTSAEGLHRFYLGASTANDAHANMFSNCGIGFEVGTSKGGGANTYARLTWHDGSTYRTGTWIQIYTGGITNARTVSYKITNDGSGNIAFWIVVSPSARSGPPSLSGVAANYSASTGPTGTTSQFTKNVFWSSENDSTSYTAGLGPIYIAPAKFLHV